MNQFSAKSAAFFLIALGSIGLNPSAHANLLTNGSFEDKGNFVDNGQDTMVLGVGSTAMPGWTVVNKEVAWIGPSNPFSLTASDGDYFLDLTSYANTTPYGGVEQTIATTAGHSYHVSFDLGSDAAYDFGTLVHVTASVNGSPTFLATATTGSLPNHWDSEGFDFTATSSSTDLSFIGHTDGTVYYVGLDNVSVTQNRSVPDAGSTLGLFALGLGLLALVGKFRRVQQ